MLQTSESTVSVDKHWPVWAFQTLMVLSLLPLAIFLLSGLQATDLTLPFPMRWFSTRSNSGRERKLDAKKKISPIWVPAQSWLAGAGGPQTDRFVRAAGHKKPSLILSSHLKPHLMLYFTDYCPSFLELVYLVETIIRRERERERERKRERERESEERERRERARALMTQ